MKAELDLLCIIIDDNKVIKNIKKEILSLQSNGPYIQNIFAVSVVVC